jgi:hypothetical protein
MFVDPSKLDLLKEYIIFLYSLMIELDTLGCILLKKKSDVFDILKNSRIWLKIKHEGTLIFD